MNYKNDYFRQVKIIMATENINQSDLATLWGISRQQVSNIMTGNGELSMARFVMLLDKYDYSMKITKE